MANRTSDTLLDVLDLDLPHTETPSVLPGPTDPITPDIEDKDQYVYTGSGPQGAHVHIAVNY
jgi:hypothetical protein